MKKISITEQIEKIKKVSKNQEVELEFLHLTCKEKSKYRFTFNPLNNTWFEIHTIGKASTPYATESKSDCIKLAINIIKKTIAAGGECKISITDRTFARV